MAAEHHVTTSKCNVEVSKPRNSDNRVLEYFEKQENCRR